MVSHTLHKNTFFNLDVMFCSTLLFVNFFVQRFKGVLTTKINSICPKVIDLWRECVKKTCKDDEVEACSENTGYCGEDGGVKDRAERLG